MTQQKQKPREWLHSKPSKILQLQRHVKNHIFRRLCKELFIPGLLQQVRCIAGQFKPSCVSAVFVMCCDNVVWWLQMGTWPSLCFYTFSTPINLLEIAAWMARRKKTDEEEGNVCLVMGRAQLLRGGAKGNSRRKWSLLRKGSMFKHCKWKRKRLTRKR